MLSRVWRCSWSSADRRCSNYIWVIDNFIAYWGASYIRGFTVIVEFWNCIIVILNNCNCCFSVHFFSNKLMWNSVETWFLWTGATIPTFGTFNLLKLNLNLHIVTDHIFKLIFLNCILVQISLKYVPEGPIDNKPALVQTMAWHPTGIKPLSEPMMA